MKLSELKKLIKEELQSIVNEDLASKLYKIEGLLVSNNDIKFQKEILSDIRSITGITTIDAKAYIPNVPNPSYSYDRLTVKVDPHPFLKMKQEFNLDIIKQIIANINDVRGVVKFKVEDPQLVNIGV